MSYQRWMNRVMALPEGAEVPEYVDTDYLGTKFIDYVHGELFVNQDHGSGDGIFTINKKLGEEDDDLVDEDEEPLPFDTVFDTVMRNFESHFGINDDAEGDEDERFSDLNGLCETASEGSDNEVDDAANNDIDKAHYQSAAEHAEVGSGPSHSSPCDFSRIHETAIMLIQSGALVNTNPQDISTPPAEIDVAIVIRRYGLPHISQILARHEDTKASQPGSTRGGINETPQFPAAEAEFEDLLSVYGPWRVSQIVKAHEKAAGV